MRKEKQPFLPLYRFKEIDRKREEKNKIMEKKLFLLMSAIYCKRENHKGRMRVLGEEMDSSLGEWIDEKKVLLCPSCMANAKEALQHSERCPHSEYKTFCHACPSSCYSEKGKENMRKVMHGAMARIPFAYPVLTGKFFLNILRAKRLMKQYLHRTEKPSQ